jgi:Tol biopolymer transport system component
MVKRVWFWLLILIGLGLLLYLRCNTDDYHLLIKPDVGGHGHGYIYYDDGVWTRRIYVGDENELEVYYADLSPDSTQIAFIRDAIINIYDLKSDQLTQIDAGLQHPSVNVNVQWSPDGRQLGFSCSHDYQGQLEICIWDIASRQLQMLTNLEAYGDYQYINLGGWSADAKTIAFSLSYSPDDAGIAHVLLLEFDPETQKVTTVFDSASLKMDLNLDLALSPDGKTILFTGIAVANETGRGRLTELYKINSDGSGLKRLVAMDQWFLFQPVWSPDGSSFYVNASNYYQTLPVRYDRSGKMIGFLPFQLGRTMLAWHSANP